MSADERRLGLSIKALKDDEDKRKAKEYRSSGPEVGVGLGDLLRQKQEQEDAQSQYQ